MITEALFVYSIILVLLLLIICMVLFYLFRKSSINEKKLSQQIHSIIESDNKRNEFFSNITHELKTPLSIILGAVQVMEIYMGGLANKELVEADNKLARNIKVVKCNCFRLLRLIYNMLDVARAEAGYQLLKPKNCDLDILLEEIVNSVDLVFTGFSGSHRNRIAKIVVGHFKQSFSNRAFSNSRWTANDHKQATFIQLHRQTPSSSKDVL